MLIGSEGREIPCQPCRNSSIHPVTGCIGGHSRSERSFTIAEICRSAPVDVELSSSTPAWCGAFRTMESACGTLRPDRVPARIFSFGGCFADVGIIEPSNGLTPSARLALPQQARDIFTRPCQKEDNQWDG